MAQSGDKYKIQIVKTGIGDPFLVVRFQFDADGISPVEEPISSLQFLFYLSEDQSFPGEKQIGSFITTKVSKLDPYRVGIPFDAPAAYTEGDPLNLRIFAYVNGHYDNVEFVNPQGVPGLECAENYATISFHPQNGQEREFFDLVYYTWPE